MLITSITRTNSSPFEKLVPEAVFEKLGSPETFALGAIFEDEEGKAAAGALFFEVDSGSNGSENLTVAVIKWLYVAKEFQRKGVADALMEEFFRIMDEAGLEHALCDIPMPEEYNFLCAYLEAWGFDFTLTNIYEITAELSEILANPLFHEPPTTNSVKKLSEIPDYYFRGFVNEMKKLADVPDFLTSAISDYDTEVSCGFMSGKELIGAMLVKKSPATGLEVVLMRAVSDVKEVMANLLLFAGAAAGKKYPPETPVKIVCRNNAAAGLLSKLFPNAQPLLVRRGYYNNEGENFEEEV
ncbi:MAG: GNAT family N-acetyltransferase [Oscillospiraceae bacterium]